MLTPCWVKNVKGTSDVWCGQTVPDGEYYQIKDSERSKWANNNKVLSDIATPSTLIVAKDDSGSNDLTTVSAGLRHLLGYSVEDVDGRSVTHATPRKLGLVTYFTGTGDDSVNDYTTGGDGVQIAWHHELGQNLVQTLIADINTIENESYLHAGLLQWKDALNDTVTCEIIPKTTSITVGSGYDYTLYGGYLIIPTIPGTGDVDVASGDRVLVEVPLNERGERLGSGYFDATWNSSTKQWDGFQANVYGTGQFNMFTVGVPLDRFANKLSVLGDGVSPLGTHDASMYGHNNRMKFTYETKGADHEWWGNSWIVFHRKRTT